MSDEVLDIINRLYKAGDDKVKEMDFSCDDRPINFITFAPTGFILGEPNEWDILFSETGAFVGVMEHYLTKDGYPFVFTDSFGKMYEVDDLDAINELLYNLVNPEIEELN